MFNNWLLKAMHLVEVLTASLLTGASVSLQLGNIFICLLIIFAGPAFVLGPLAK